MFTNVKKTLKPNFKPHLRIHLTKSSCESEWLQTFFIYLLKASIVALLNYIMFDT